MNKIVESINFASDSYWGDPERFKFRASIDNYTTTTELSQGTDRTVKTTFQIKMAGYIVSDAINTSVGNPNKFFSKAAVSFGMETAGSSEMLMAKAGTPAKSATNRFYDQGKASSGMTLAQINYVGLSTTAVADNVEGTVASFSNYTIASPPPGFILSQEDFKVYINGQYINVLSRTVSQSGQDVVVTFSDLEYPVDINDQILLVGKFS
jgi:hypothetical protein